MDLDRQPQLSREKAPASKGQAQSEESLTTGAAKRTVEVDLPPPTTRIDDQSRISLLVANHSEDIRNALIESRFGNSTLYREIVDKVLRDSGEELWVYVEASARIQEMTGLDLEYSRGGQPSREEASAPKADAAEPKEEVPHMPTASWVIKERETGAILFETFNPEVEKRLNQKKYEAVPILEHLQSLNRSARNLLVDEVESPVTPISDATQKNDQPRYEERLDILNRKFPEFNR
jgi:hypothetical protein